MIPKPPACIGCPAYTWGPSYVPDEEDHSQHVIVLAQNPGESEEKGRRFLGWSGAGGEKWAPGTPRPLIGKSGYDMERHFLPLSGLTRDDVRCGNVIRCRWKGGNTLPPLTQSSVRGAIRHCQQAHFIPPQVGQTVVVLGAYALWAMTGEFGAEGSDEDDDSRASRSLDGWRGWVVPSHQYPDITIFATYHPAFFYRAHWLKPVGKMDWARLGKLTHETWPEPPPTILRQAPAQWPVEVAWDTEYNPATGELHRYSVAWRDQDDVPHIHVVEAADLRRVGGPPPRRLIAHNLEADRPYLESVFGTNTMDWDDTMFMHSVLHGTLRHTLDFLGSVYARTNRWKHLEQSDEIMYSGLDALGTWDAWVAMDRELARDPQSREVYEEELKPLLPHILRRPAIHLDAVKVAEGVEALSRQQADSLAQAHAAAGWPLNIASPHQVARWLAIKGAHHDNHDTFGEGIA